jgi:hypothetical protein
METSVGPCFLVFIFGAAGTCLAAAKLSIFVAVTVGIAVAVQGSIEKTSPLTQLMAHNRCIGDLSAARAWQGLTLFHFSAQVEPCPTQESTLHLTWGIPEEGFQFGSDS